MYDYDFFVIGGGSAGIRAAKKASNFGAKVAIAEGKKLGGTCVNLGCMPKKFLYNAAAFNMETKLARSNGWEFDTPKLNWGLLQNNISKEISRLNDIYKKILNNSSIDIFNSNAKFISKNEIILDDKIITAKSILIATGGYPIRPNFKGAEFCITSDEFFKLEKFPKSIIIIGSGYIALEIASIMSDLGSDVTILVRNNDILKNFDEDIRSFIKESLEKKSIKIICNTETELVQKNNSNNLKLIDKNKNEYVAEQILFAAGRKANLDGLNLDGVGVFQDKFGAIIVDEDFKTSVDNIYAAGDVTNKLNLTPVAIAQGDYIASNLFADKSKSPYKFDYKNVPTAIFTNPNVATIGLSEEEAKLKFSNIKSYKTIFTPSKYALLENSDLKQKFLIKIIVDTDCDEKLIGIHIVGHDSAEIIQAFAPLISMGAKKSDLNKIIPIHPTIAEEIFFLK